LSVVKDIPESLFLAVAKPAWGLQRLLLGVAEESDFKTKHLKTIV